MDIEAFNTDLQTKLTNNSPAHMIISEEAFHTKINQLTAIIKETIIEQVPVRKPCPFSKRWWNPDLTALKKKKNRLSNKAYKLRNITITLSSKNIRKPPRNSQKLSKRHPRPTGQIGSKAFLPNRSISPTIT
jgi:hypothetical protein